MVEAREEHPARRRVEALARRWREHLWRIIVTTVGSCLRHRVTGLAAEAAFFAVLSVAPLVFDLAGAIGVADLTWASLEAEASGSVKRVLRPATDDAEPDWTTVPNGPRRILAFTETKTVWHPKGV